MYLSSYTYRRWCHRLLQLLLFFTCPVTLLRALVLAVTVRFENVLCACLHRLKKWFLLQHPVSSNFSINPLPPPHHLKPSDNAMTPVCMSVFELPFVCMYVHVCARGRTWVHVCA